MEQQRCSIELIRFGNNITPVRYCTNHSKYEFDYTRYPEQFNCDLYRSLYHPNDDVTDSVYIVESEPNNSSYLSAEDDVSPGSSGTVQGREESTAGTQQQPRTSSDANSDNDDDDDDDEQQDNDIRPDREGVLNAVQRSAFFERVALYRNMRRRREFRSLDNEYQNNSIPFHHLVTFMMGPLYYDPHYSRLNKWNACIARILHDDEASHSGNIDPTANLYFMPRRCLSRTLDIAEDTYVSNAICRRVFKIFSVMNKCLMTLLSRIRDRGDTLTGAPMQQRTLQSVFDVNFVSDYWDRFSTDPYIAGLIPLTYDEMLDYLYVWRKLQETIPLQLSLQQRQRISIGINIIIEIKLNTGWSLLPTLATSGSCAFDVFSSEQKIIPRSFIPVLVHIGIENIRLPAATYVYILSRSGMTLRHKITVANSPGLIDTDYRGSVGVLLCNLNKEHDYIVEIGDRIAQIQVVNKDIRTQSDVTWREVNIILNNETDRGVGGFGSTGF